MPIDLGWMGEIVQGRRNDAVWMDENRVGASRLTVYDPVDDKEWRDVTPIQPPTKVAFRRPSAGKAGLEVEVGGAPSSAAVAVNGDSPTGAASAGSPSRLSKGSPSRRSKKNKSPLPRRAAATVRRHLETCVEAC